MNGIPLSLANKIEKVGRANTAKELAACYQFRRCDSSTQPPEGFRPSFHSAPGFRFHPGAATNWLRSQ